MKGFHTRASRDDKAFSDIKLDGLKQKHNCYHVLVLAKLLKSNQAWPNIYQVSFEPQQSWPKYWPEKKNVHQSKPCLISIVETTLDVSNDYLRHEKTPSYCTESLVSTLLPCLFDCYWLRAYLNCVPLPALLATSERSNVKKASKLSTHWTLLTAAPFSPTASHCNFWHGAVQKR